MAVATQCPTPSERIRTLSHHASLVEVDKDMSPKRYFRSGVEIERMAKTYQDERNYESAFILYTKYVTLFVEKLPKHPDYATVTKYDKSSTMKKIPKIFQIAEELKRILTKRYEEEYKAWEEAEKKWKAEEEKRRKEQERLKEEENKRAEQQLVQELENRERNRSLHDAVPAVVPSAPPAEGPLSSTLIGDFPVPPTLNRTVDSNSTITGDNNRQHGTPSVATEPSRPASSFASLYSVTTSTPYVDRSTKPLDTSSDSSTVGGLRKVSIPSALISRFLDIASPNTRRNVETCGILTGRLQQNQFCITHLVVPKQTSTSDSCTTLCEEDMFEYQDSHDLITLGWIHTHPSQTAFMSSVDLHTHCSYQLMMPEAIAIVCSPKYGETGVFTLTQDYGIQFVASCKKPGFHPHPKEPPLYQESEHIIWDKIARIEIGDLR